MPLIAECAEPRTLYAAKEAAALLKISLRTFQRYVKNGYIRRRYRKQTLRPLYLGADLNKFYANLI